jgi:hypothetical protein
LWLCEKHWQWWNKVTDKNFEDILNDCLERLLIKGETIEACLSIYPQQADSLKPLLQTALVTKKAIAIEPRPEFKARARYQFHTALQETASRKSRPFSVWRVRWATVLTTILVMLLASGGMVAASSNSMPDEPLYPVKLAVEQLQLRLTFSDLGKATLYAEFADRRVAEIIQIAQEGNVSLAESVTQRLDNQLAMISTLYITERQDGTILEGATKAPAFGMEQQPPVPTLALPEATADTNLLDTYTTDEEMSELACLLQQKAASNATALRNALTTAPEAVKPALIQAIAISEAGYENAINAIGE